MSCAGQCEDASEVVLAKHEPTVCSLSADLWDHLQEWRWYKLKSLILLNNNFSADLRQDMLVIQVLEVMDSIWKVHQIDCCLSTYPILPMGSNVGLICSIWNSYLFDFKVGLIGCVSNCATIFEIQSEGGKVGTAVKSLDTKFLNQYLREHSKDNAKE